MRAAALVSFFGVGLVVMVWGVGVLGCWGVGVLGCWLFGGEFGDDVGKAADSTRSKSFYKSSHQSRPESVTRSGISVGFPCDKVCNDCVFAGFAIGLLKRLWLFGCHGLGCWGVVGCWLVMVSRC